MSPQSNAKSPSQLVAEVLLNNGVLTREQLSSAVSEARSQRRGLTYTLVSLELIEENVLLRLLSRIFKVKAVELSKIERIDPSALTKLSAQVAERGLVLPIHRSDDTLTVAMVNPTNRATVAHLEQLTGLKIQPVVATEFALRNAISKHYSTARPQAPPQPQRAARHSSGKLHLQTRARNAPRRAAAPPTAPKPTAAAAAPQARPLTAPVVPGPVVASPTDGPTTDAAATGPQGERSDPEDLLRKQMEAEAALANMSFRGAAMGDEGSGKRLIAIGGALIIGGGVMTCASYSAAGDGGSFVVTIGLFIAGAALLFRGLMADWSP